MTFKELPILNVIKSLYNTSIKIQGNIMKFTYHNPTTIQFGEGQIKSITKSILKKSLSESILLKNIFAPF